MQTIGFCTQDAPCPYLSDRRSRTEYLYVRGCDFDYNTNLVRHGYRRFGEFFQKPACNACDECKSMRVDAQNFVFSKSLRRLMRRNSDLTISVSAPNVDFDHLELFRRYHAFKSEHYNWPRMQSLGYREYCEIYVDGHGDFGKEVAYCLDGRLVCVDLIDVVDDGISSIYCYYDPDMPRRALGKYSLLKEIEIAQKIGVRWIYLGYYVKDCRSLAYKADYTPFELLQDYTEPDEPAVWLGENL